MLRALLWKEWRELRLLRLAGLALGLVLPLAFLLGAEAFRRGLSPFGKGGGYSNEDLFYSILPGALALALWPLLALLTVAQAFCGDRASGREAFLLERPVGRGRVFVARLLASFGSVLVIVVGTAAIGGTIARLTAGPPHDSTFVTQMLLLGLALSLVAVLSGLGAASLLQSPMAAVLLALLLAGIPFLLGTQLAGLFPLAALGNVPVGLVLPWLLLPAYALAGWLGLCRGEPAGRGRLGRSIGTIAGALGVVLLAFPIAAFASVRLGAPFRWIAASPRTQAAVVLAGGSTGRGWIVDLPSGRRTRFLPPPVQYALWSSDGSRVAVLTSSGPLGSWADSRIEVYDSKGDPVGAPIPVPEELYLAETIWAGSDLVAIASSRARKEDSTKLLFFHVPNGTLASRDLPGHGWDHWLLGPATDGALYLASVTGAATQLRHVDVEHRSVEPAPVMSDASAGRGGGISPSGRYWLRVDRGEGIRKARVVDLETGSQIPGPGIHRRGVWLAEDRLAWVEHTPEKARLLVARPGEGPRAVAEWDRACVALERSPSGDAALLHVRSNAEAPCDDANEFDGPSIADEGAMQRRTGPEVVIYEPEGEALRVVPLTSREREEGIDVHWAAARTLARIGPDSLTFEDVAPFEK